MPVDLGVSGGRMRGGRRGHGDGHGAMLRGPAAAGPPFPLPGPGKSRSGREERHNGAVGTPQFVVRSGHPEFLGLPWDRPLAEWGHPRRLDLPKGISRHEVQFFGYDDGIYAVKELPRALARHEYAVLRQLEDLGAPSVRPLGLVERPWLDPYEEASAAVVTRYVEYAFSYRELLSGWGFGERRNQLLDAFAGLLVELHLLGCHWGDCSLSNVLYRYDAGAVDMTMVDAETARLYPALSDGQREDDLQLMVENVGGGMADLAAEHGTDLDLADLFLGEDIAARYHPLWREVTGEPVVGPRRAVPHHRAHPPAERVGLRGGRPGAHPPGGRRAGCGCASRWPGATSTPTASAN